MNIRTSGSTSFPGLFPGFESAVMSNGFDVVKTPSSKRLPSRHNQLSYRRCFEQNRHQHSKAMSRVPKKDIVILLPYLGLPQLKQPSR